MKNDPLMGVLQECSLYSLLICVSRALTRTGFGDVQLLDRRSSKQKSRYGGHEIMCETTVGSYPAKVVVKVIKDDVRTRMVDELVGTGARTNADLALIISPFNISESLVKTQESYRPVRVEFLDGAGLAQLLRRSGIGIRPKGGVDFRFFAELEEMSKRLLTFMAQQKQ